MENCERHKDIEWINVGKYINRTYLLVNLIANFCGALLITVESRFNIPEIPHKFLSYITNVKKIRY